MVVILPQCVWCKEPPRSDLTQAPTKRPVANDLLQQQRVWWVCDAHATKRPKYVLVDMRVRSFLGCTLHVCDCHVLHEGSLFSDACAHQLTVLCVTERRTLLMCEANRCRVDPPPLTPPHFKSHHNTANARRGRHAMTSHGIQRCHRYEVAGTVLWSQPELALYDPGRQRGHGHVNTTALFPTGLRSRLY